MININNYNYTEIDGMKYKLIQDDVMNCLKKYKLTVYDAKEILKTVITEIENKSRFV